MTSPIVPYITGDCPYPWVRVHDENKILLSKQKHYYENIHSGLRILDYPLVNGIQCSIPNNFINCILLKQPSFEQPELKRSICIR